MKSCKSIQQHSAALALQLQYNATRRIFEGIGFFCCCFFLQKKKKKRSRLVIRLSSVISKAIHHDCQTQAPVPACQRVVHPRISLPTFTRWVPLEMPSVCLSPGCHVCRLNQVIAAGMSQASAVPYSHGSSSSCFVSPLWASAKSTFNLRLCMRD